METVGLDVHKGTVFCCIHNGERCLDIEEYATFTRSIRSMGDYLQEHQVDKVGMESNSIYWVSIWNILEEIDLS